MMRLLVMALCLSSWLVAAQHPSICGIEGPTTCGKGDPVSVNSGYSFHIASDLELNTGAEGFVLRRYFAPVGGLGGSKSPLDGVIGAAWPPSAPPGPFGTWTGDGGFQVDVRPTWSHDAYSFVVPTTSELSDGGSGPNVALLFEGNFKWTVFGRTGSTGMQSLFGNNPGAPARLEALSGGYRYIRADREQWIYQKLLGTTPNNGPVLLSEVRRPNGQLKFSVEYPSTGCTNQISALIFRTGGRLEFTYNSGSCTLNGLSWRGSGASSATAVASYSYWNSQPGRVSQGGSLVDPETYSYPAILFDAGAGIPIVEVGWEFNVIQGPGGTVKATHLYAPGGGPVYRYSGHGRDNDFNLSSDTGYFSSTQPEYLQCNVQTDSLDEQEEPVFSSPLTYELLRTIEVTSESGGSPTAGSIDVTSDFAFYNDDIFGSGTSRFGKQTDDCGSSSCANGTTVSAVVPLNWNAANICSDGRDGGSPAVPYAFKDKRGSWSLERVVQHSSGEQMPVFSAVGMSSFAAPLADGGAAWQSAGALEHATLNSTPQVLNSVRINSRVEVPSSLSPGNNTVFDQRFIDTGASNGFPTRFMELAWQAGYTLNYQGDVVSKIRGTFFRRERACSGGTTTDPANRVLRVEGPCFLQSDTSNQCEGTEFPVTEFHYYGSAANENDRGRLEKVVRYPNFSTSNCHAGLSTTYADYTVEGLPRTVTDENGITKTFTFSGRRMLSQTVADAGTVFAYEVDGTLRSIQNPEGDYEVFCRHANSSSSCDFGAALLPHVKWRAKSGSSNGSSAAERIDFDYWGDGQLKFETYKDGTGATRLVKSHYPDGSGRQTWEGVGGATDGGATDGGVVAVKRRFDSNNNLIGVGSSFTGAPDFCSLTTPSPLCSWMTYDRADRLAQLELNPSGTTGAQTKTCIDYDGQGNVRRVLPGCAASATCSINSSSGASSSCTDGEPTDYLIDDFGDVAAVTTDRTTWFERNALGLPIKRKMAALDALGIWNEWTYDQLGRLLTATKEGTGGSEQLFALVYDAAIPGTSCPSAATARVLGRLGYREDSFGLTGYSYDERGRVIKEWRQRMGDYGACGSSYLSNPTTSYTYSANGNLTSITYPHGRTVTYVYGTGGRKNRIDAMSVTTWDGTSWQTQSLLSGVDWEPYGDLREYSFVTGSGTSNTVTYSKSGPAQTPVSDACSANVPTGASDSTGRPTGVFVSQDGGWALKKFLSWTGEQLTTEQTCFPVLGQATEHRQTYTHDKTARLTGVTGTNMPMMTHGPGDAGWAGGHARSYGYTPQGERGSSSIDGCSWDLRMGHHGQLESASASPNCASSLGDGPEFLYDDSGRTTEVTSGPSGAEQFRMELAHNASGGGLESVFSSVTLKRFSTELVWEYYYDAFNRRRAKVPPTGAEQMEEFFYDLGHQELESIGPGGSTVLQVDDSVWLAGRLVAVARGRLNRADSERLADTGFCEREGESTYQYSPSCGFFMVVNDSLPKPILTLEKTSGDVTGAALYDEFGHINRVPFVAGANTGGTQTLGEVSLPVGTQGIANTIARVFWRRLSNANGTNNNSSDLTYGPLAAQWGEWIPRGRGKPIGAGVEVVASPFGAQTEAVEYRRFHVGAFPWFPNLRFPGQHWDEETDLFENWNRFYDPGSGRFFSPEPLLRSPTYVARMAQRGMGVPTYAYAASNPIRFADPTGLFLVAASDPGNSSVNSSEDYALVNELVSRARNSKCAREVVDEIESRSNHVVVAPGRLGLRDPIGSGPDLSTLPVIGYVPDAQSQNGPGIVYLYMDPEFISDGFAGWGDPVGDLLHELVHTMFVMDERDVGEAQQHDLITGHRKVPKKKGEKQKTERSRYDSVMDRYKECKKKEQECQ